MAVGAVRWRRARARLSEGTQRTKRSTEGTKKEGRNSDSRRPGLPMPFVLCALCVFVVRSLPVVAAEPVAGRDNERQRMAEKLPERDVRLTRVRTLEEGISFQPPRSTAAWSRRQKEVREQIL